MQRARRWRTVVKWGLLASAVGLATLAIASWRWEVSWYGKDARTVKSVGVFSGAARAGWAPLLSGHTFRSGWTVRDNEISSSVSAGWLLKVNAAWNASSGHFKLPLWIPFVLALGPYVMLARADRLAAKRAKAHACPACGYDLAGLAPAAVCPECGKGVRAGGTS